MKKLFGALIVVGLVMIAGWWYRWQTVKQPKINLTVAASIYPVYDLVRQVAGEKVEVLLLVPPGASEHLYEPTPKDIIALQSAKMVFVIGHGLDNWITKIAVNNPSIEQVTLDQNIPLLPSSEDHEEGEEAEAEAEESPYDPHYWLSLNNALSMVDTITANLIAIDPENASTYQANASQLKAEIAALKSEAVALKNQSNVTKIATFHNAWTYFAKEFDLEVVATFEPYAGQEPSPAYLSDFQKKVREANLSVVYSEPQSSTQGLETVANDLNISFRPLDPLGGTIDKDTYVTLMRSNIEQIFQP